MTLSKGSFPGVQHGVMPPSHTWAPAARHCWLYAQNPRERFQVPAIRRPHGCGQCSALGASEGNHILRSARAHPKAQRVWVRRGPPPWGREPRDYRAEFLKSSHSFASLWRQCVPSLPLLLLRFSLTLFLLQSAEASENIVQIFTPAF